MTPQDIPAILLKHGSLKAAARAEVASWRQLSKNYGLAIEQGIIVAPRLGKKTNAHLKNPTVTIKQRAKALKTKKHRHHTYILTCAQNNTKTHLPTWLNLLALAKDREAKIFVSTFLYAARSHWQKNLDKGAKHGPNEEVWYDPTLVPFINNERVEIAKGLVWCGELNISPTAVAPLSGLEVFTARASMVVPHVTVAMESIAGLGGSGAKLNFTTGTVTQRNYIQRKEGFKAEFHHSYGALLVEVDDAGHWWCRQLNADSDGTIYDFDTQVKDGKITTGHRVEAITLGDTHNEVRDETVHRATFGDGGLVPTLDPKSIFVHDIVDMGRRGHHSIKDPYLMMLAYASQKESVRDVVTGAKDFLTEIADPERREIVVVSSNHDRHLDRWITDTDGRYDPVNADYWGLLNHWKTDYIMRHHNIPDMLHLAMVAADHDFTERNRVTFLDGNSSFVICGKFGGGIECALHGDRGANGSRGSRRQFARALGRRSNVGHSHSAGITQGCYQAGTNSEMDLGYNKGLSAWTHSDIITYANGKRAIVTFFRGKWRA
jgi:hypothetical protein